MGIATKTIKRRVSWPRWAKWVAKNVRGEDVLFSHKPNRSDGKPISWFMWSPLDQGRMKSLGQSNLPGPWRNSLRKII